MSDITKNYSPWDSGLLFCYIFKKILCSLNQHKNRGTKGKDLKTAETNENQGPEISYQVILRLSLIEWSWLINSEQAEATYDRSDVNKTKRKRALNYYCYIFLVTKSIVIIFEEIIKEWT